MSTYDLSIDIGMTSTRAALHRGSGIVEVVDLGPVRSAIRTFVYLDHDGVLVVGEAAARRAESDSEGAHDGSFVHACASATPVSLREDVWRPEDLFARSLRTIVERVATTEGALARRVGAIVPPSFDANALKRLEAACSRAGLGGVLFISSVQAIASAYAAQGQIPDGPFVAVDFGAHGTGIGQFEAANGAARAISSPETLPFGGDSCDAVVLGLMASGLGLASWSPSAARAARGRCRDAKEQLSALDRTQISAEDIQPGSRSRVDITRATLASAIAEPLDAVVRRLVVLRPSAIAVAGGTSYIPAVRAALERIGVPLLNDIDPIFAPAMGATLVTADAELFRFGAPDPGLGASSATVVVTSGLAPDVSPIPRNAIASTSAGNANVAATIPGVAGVASTNPAPLPETNSTSPRRTWLAVGAVVAAAVVLVGGLLAWNVSRGDNNGGAPSVNGPSGTNETLVDSTPPSKSGAVESAPVESAPVESAPVGSVPAPVESSPTGSAGVTTTTPLASARLASAENMVEIPAGSYPIGSLNPDVLSETLRREVAVDKFFIDANEVTNVAYKAFVDQANGAAPLTGWRQGRPPADQLESPVRGVNFDWAEAYCFSLGKRLPTETQWEIAAAGPAGSKWAWGDDPTAVKLPSDGVYAVKSIAGNVSSFGVYDLTGNAWEWVREPYDVKRVGVGQHLLRGGQNGYVRNNWTRLPIDPEASTSVLSAGFRCAAGAVDPTRAPAEFDDFVRPPDPKRPEAVVRPGYLIYDEFTDSSSGWIERSTPGWRYGYHPNKFFHLETKRAGETVVALAPTNAPQGNISIEAAAEVELDLTGSTGTYEWGLVARADLPVGDSPVPKRFVAFVIDNRRQTWHVFVQDGEKRTTLLENPFNVAETDNLSIEIGDRGSKLDFYINTRFVGEADVSAFNLEERRAGFIVIGGPDSMVTHLHFGRFAMKVVN